MEKAPSIDVEVEGHQYRISRLNAEDGGWVLRMQMQSIGAGRLTEGVMPNALAGGLSETEWRRMRQLLLSVVCRHKVVGEAEIWEPLVNAAGRYNFPDLAYDAVSLEALAMHSQVFNMKPFFAGGGFERIRQSLEALSPSTSQSSTLTSGDPS